MRSSGRSSPAACTSARLRRQRVQYPATTTTEAGHRKSKNQKPAQSFCCPPFYLGIGGIVLKKANWLLETLQKPARLDHPAAPSIAGSVVPLADRRNAYRKGEWEGTRESRKGGLFGWQSVG